MKALLPLLVVLSVVAVAVACDSSVTMTGETEAAPPVDQAAAKQEKILVCHVGDDGTISLLSVATASRHLGNPAHAHDGMVDYAPTDVGATGIGKDDSDGNGVDDGCEIPPDVTCPCFAADDLAAHGEALECGENFPDFPDLAGVFFADGSVACSGASCNDSGPDPQCGLNEFEGSLTEFSSLSADQDAACRSLILDACPTPNLPVAGKRSQLGRRYFAGR